MFTTVFDHCSDPMKAKIEIQNDSEHMSDNFHLVKLTKYVQVWMLNQQQCKSQMMASHTSVIALCSLKERNFKILINYEKRFMVAARILDCNMVDLWGCFLKNIRKDIKKGHDATFGSATEEQIDAGEKEL